MLLFRSLSVGLLGACALLLATRSPETKIVHETEWLAARTNAPTIIDVAPNTSSQQIAQLVHLLPDEHVTSVNDRPVTSTLDAGVAIMGSQRNFVDLTIEQGSRERRVLVLIH